MTPEQLAYLQTILMRFPHRFRDELLSEIYIHVCESKALDSRPDYKKYLRNLAYKRFRRCLINNDRPLLIEVSRTEQFDILRTSYADLNEGIKKLNPKLQLTLEAVREFDSFVEAASHLGITYPTLMKRCKVICTKLRSWASRNLPNGGVFLE